MLHIDIDKEFEHSVIPIGKSNQIINVSYVLQPDAEEELQKKWDRLLSDRLDIPYTVSTQQARQQVADEMNEELLQDYSEAYLTSVANNPNLRPQLREMRLQGERALLKQRVEPDTSLEERTAENLSFDDMIGDIDVYQNSKVDDEVAYTANNLTMHELLAKEIGTVLEDFSMSETLLKRTLGDTGGTMIGGAVAGPIGGALGYIGYQAIGMGKDSVSVNTVAKEFIDKFKQILPNSTSKVEAYSKLKQLVKETFTPNNREYWNDIATGILEGPRAYLDSGLVGGAAIGSAAKNIGKVYNKLFHKVRTSAQAQKEAISDVLEGEIVTNKAMSLKDPSEPNGGVDPRVIDLHFVGSDDGVARWSIDDYKRIGTGPASDAEVYNNIIALDFKKYIAGVDKRNYVTPATNYLDFDMALGMAPVHYVGGGSDGRQVMSFTKAMQKAHNINQQALKDRNSIAVYGIKQGDRNIYRFDTDGYEKLMTDSLIREGWWKPYEAKDIKEYIKKQHNQVASDEQVNVLVGWLDDFKQDMAKRVVKNKQSLNKAFEDHLKIFSQNNARDVEELQKGNTNNHLFLKELTEHFLAPTKKNVKMPRVTRLEIKDPDKIFFEGKRNSKFVRDAVSKLHKEKYQDTDFIFKLLGQEGVKAMVSRDGKVLLSSKKVAKKVGSLSLSQYGGTMYESEHIYKASPKRAFPMRQGEGWVVAVVDDFSPQELDKFRNVKYNARINPKEIERNAE